MNGLTNWIVKNVETQIEQGGLRKKAKFKLSQVVPEWKELSPGQQKTCGREFCEAVRQGEMPWLALAGKDENNHRMYRVA